MKNERSGRCPGCGKHCPLSAPKCKYGVRYAVRQQEKAVGETVGEGRHLKWEKHVASGGLAWKLLHVSRRIKKALVSGAQTEERLFSALSESERQTLGELMDKLNVCLQSGNSGKVKS